jgi:clan AA aspartic protease (TIGR02281 family)
LRRSAAVVCVTAQLLAGAALAQAPAGGDASQAVARWNASNGACRSREAPAIEAIGACEQRDTYSKLLALANYCYGPSEKGGPAGWSPCDAAKLAQDSALARTTARFQRMGGVFVLPGTINGGTKTFFIVDSGAANVQIPEEVADEMKRAGTLADSDFLGERRFLLADGRGLQQHVFRLRSLQIGERTMENVLAAVGAPHSRALLGQSFLRRLNWWKIDNVKNAIELEFTCSF